MFLGIKISATGVFLANMSLLKLVLVIQSCPSCRETGEKNPNNQ